MRLGADFLRDSAEVDPLDTQFGPVSAGPALPRRRSSRVRRWRGASPGGRAALLLLPLGMALGPQGLNVLSLPVLAALDPAVSVIVGVLGVLIGLGLDFRRPREGRLLAAGATSAAVAALVVGGGAFAALMALMAADRESLAATVPLALAVLIGMCGCRLRIAGRTVGRGLASARVAAARHGQRASDRGDRVAGCVVPRRHCGSGARGDAAGQLSLR